MKKMLLSFLVILSTCYFACKKENNDSKEVYGTWKLTKTMQDPGDGSGKYIAVKGASKFLVLDRNGNFSGDAIPELSAFKILDSVKMEVTFKSQNKPLVYRYKVSAKSLLLNPPCIEGCGFLFERK
jgi:hypothetical protein